MASSCSTTARSASATSATTSAVDRELGDLGEPRPARLLGRLAGGRAPPGQRLGRALALPDRDAARGRPGDDPRDADLGEHLDGELAPIALRDRLDDDDSGVAGVDRSTTVSTVSAKTRLPVDPTAPAHRAPDAVGEHDLLADPQPAYGDRVVRLVALDGDLVTDGDAVERRDEVDRERHRTWLSAG